MVIAFVFISSKRVDLHKDNYYLKWIIRAISLPLPSNYPDILLTGGDACTKNNKKEEYFGISQDQEGSNFKIYTPPTTTSSHLYFIKTAAYKNTFTHTHLHLLCPNSMSFLHFSFISLANLFDKTHTCIHNKSLT